MSSLRTKPPTDVTKVSEPRHECEVTCSPPAYSLGKFNFLPPLVLIYMSWLCIPCLLSDLAQR